MNFSKVMLLACLLAVSSSVVSAEECAIPQCGGADPNFTVDVVTTGEVDKTTFGFLVCNVCKENCKSVTDLVIGTKSGVTTNPASETKGCVEPLGPGQLFTSNANTLGPLATAQAGCQTFYISAASSGGIEKPLTTSELCDGACKYSLKTNDGKIVCGSVGSDKKPEAPKPAPSPYGRRKLTLRRRRNGQY